MLLDECFCSYHSLQQQHNHLTQKLQHLEVHNRCQQQELINGNFHHQQHQNMTTLPNGGKKRNFSSVDNNEDVDMECQGAGCGDMNQQRKVFFFSITFMFLTSFLMTVLHSLSFYIC